MDFTLVEANKADHEVLLENLLSLYLYDLSEFFDIALDANGRYTYDYDWSLPHGKPFLAYQGSLPVGFALVNKGSTIGHGDDIQDMQEFFILRSSRRTGAGIWLAHKMYKAFTGRWEIRIGEKNLGALAFWRNSLNDIECTEPEEIFIKAELGGFYCISTTMT